MKNLFFLFCIPLLFFGLGSLNAQTKWTKIEYYYNVGSLPPPYHYEYTITINSDGSGKLHYVAGYKETDGNTFNYVFETGKPELKKLKKEIKKSNILNLDIMRRPDSEIPDGGHSDNLIIYGFKGKNTDTEKLLKEIPSYPDLKYEKILKSLYKIIRDCVPDEIWDEVEGKKAELQN